MAIAPATVLSPGVVETPRRGLHGFGRLAFAVALGATVGAALLLLGLKLAGWQMLTVLTGSMRPTIAPGQVVVVSPLSAADIMPGQIVTFRRPGGPGTMTHRVERVAALPDGRRSITTKGDANVAGETWQIPADGRVGLHRASLPAAGGALGSVVAGPGRPYLVAGTVLVGTALVLLWIWAPSPGRLDEPSPQDGSSTSGTAS